MAVLRHLVGSSAEWGDEGLQYREVMAVTGVSQSNFAQAIHDALLQTPQRNATLVLGTAPNDTTLYMRSKSFTKVSNEKGLTSGRVQLTASWFQFVAPANDPQEQPDDDGAGVSTVGSVVETVQTEFDSAGAEITVKRDASSPDLIQPVQYRKPRSVAEFSRWEQNSPQSRADTYVGKLNSAVWNGYAAGTVLCSGIVGTTRDGGDTYDVRYEFEIDANGWDETVVYIDEDTGRPISPLVDTVSKKTVTLYTSISFSGLNITL